MIPADIPPLQRALLERLLAALEADPNWRWFELAASLARGAGDEMSDVDCGTGAADFEAGLSTVDALVVGLGDVVDTMQEWLGGDRTMRHVFVQYADGVQLSLVVMPATNRPGLPPGSVALLDRDGQLAKPWTPSSYAASAEDSRAWTFLGWIALSDLDKYLRRGSLWEARQRLEEARGEVLRLWAHRHDVGFAVFGLTAVLDQPGLALPADLDRTLAGLDAGELRAAALAVADLLRELGPDLPMATYVHGRLVA